MKLPTGVIPKGKNPLSTEQIPPLKADPIAKVSIAKGSKTRSHKAYFPLQNDQLHGGVSIYRKKL